MSYDWINDYIGIPYECNARGPNAYDCFGLCVAVYKNQLGVDVPDWKVDDTAAKTAMRAITGAVAEEMESGRAEQVTEPQDFDIVVLVRHGLAHHVGIYIAGGVLHTRQGGSGAVFEPVTNFEQAGRGKLEIYRWHV